MYTLVYVIGFQGNLILRLMVFKPFLFSITGENGIICSLAKNCHPDCILFYLNFVCIATAKINWYAAVALQ